MKKAFKCFLCKLKRGKCLFRYKWLCVMGVLSIGLFFSCAKEIDYYRVTVKTADGTVLYEGEKPELKVMIITSLLNEEREIIVYTGYYNRYSIVGSNSHVPHYECSGNNLLVTRVFTKRETGKK